MAKQSQNEKDILLAVHETALDLYGAGFIDKKKMLKYDALCIEAVPTYVQYKFANYETVIN